MSGFKFESLNFMSDDLSQKIADANKEAAKYYESPIVIHLLDNGMNFSEHLENAVICELQQKYAIEVHKEQLIAALNYDKDQYYNGYHRGYFAAKDESILDDNDRDLLKHIITVLLDNKYTGAACKLSDLWNKLDNTKNIKDILKEENTNESTRD